MNKKEKRGHLNNVVSAAKSLTCKDLHHKKTDHHETGVVCMAEYRLNKSIQVIESVVEQSIIDRASKLDW